MKYFERVADSMLQERLEAFSAVLIEEPKWTGKTSTGEPMYAPRWCAYHSAGGFETIIGNYT